MRLISTCSSYNELWSVSMLNQSVLIIFTISYFVVKKGRLNLKPVQARVLKKSISSYFIVFWGFFISLFR